MAIILNTANGSITLDAEDGSGNVNVTLPRAGFESGDITGVTAGTGLTGGGASGAVTLTVGAAQTGITSIYATDLILGEDTQTAIDFGTVNEIDFKVDNAARLTMTSGALYPVTTNQIDLGTASLEFKDAFFDGTVTADAFAGPLTGNAATATLATTATVTDSAANTNFPVVFHDESNALLDDTGALRYNPSTGQLLVPNLTVAGTTTQVDTVTMNAQNAVVFEGATADAYETILSIVDPTADHTQYLVNQDGYIPVLAASTTTAITSTPAELNALDGIPAGLTATEIGYVDGVTSAIQTQLDSKSAQPTLKGVNFTMSSGEFIIASAGSITLTLPSGPSAGDNVTIKDGTGAAATTSFTVARNSSNIASSATDLTFDKNFHQITMTYIDSTIGWSV